MHMRAHAIIMEMMLVSLAQNSMYACFIAAFLSSSRVGRPCQGVVQRIAQHNLLDSVQLRSAWRHNDIVIDLWFASLTGERGVRLPDRFPIGQYKT